MDVDGSWASLVLLLSSFASLMFLEILFTVFSTVAFINRFLPGSGLHARQGNHASSQQLRM